MYQKGQKGRYLMVAFSCQDFRERLDELYLARGFFFFNSEQLAHTDLIFSFFLGQSHSTVAQRAETTVAECSLTTCV